MAKDKSTSRDKGLQRLKAAKPVSSPSQRVLSDAKKLKTSLKKLVYSSVKRVVDQCRGALVAASQRVACQCRRVWGLIKQTCKKIANLYLLSSQWLVKNYRRAFAFTKQSFINFVLLVRKGLDLTRNQIVNSALKIAEGYRRVCLSIKQTALNLIAQCSEGLERARLSVTKRYRKIHLRAGRIYQRFVMLCRQKIVQFARIRRKIVRQYKAACSRIRQAYKKLVRRCQEIYARAIEGIFAIGQKVASGYQNGCFGARKSATNLVARQYRRACVQARKIRRLCRQGFHASKQAVFSAVHKVAKGSVKFCFLATQSAKNFATFCYLKVAKGYQRSRIGIGQAYRKLRGLCLFAKQGIVAIGSRVASGYRKVYLAIKQACQNSASYCIEGLEKSRLKAASHYRKVISGTKRTCKTLERESRQTLKGLNLKISDQNQKVKQSAMTFSTKLFRRLRVGTKRTYKNLVRECRQGLLASATFCRKVAIGTSQACKNAVSGCYQSLVAFILKIVKQFQKMGSAAAQSWKNLVKKWDYTLDVSRRKLLAFGLKMARGYRKALIGTGRAYRDFLRLCLSAFGAAKQQIHLAGLKIARKNLRAVVIARRTYRDFLRLCLSAFGAAKQQIHLAGLKIARTNLRAVVIARRTYRDFLRLCLSAFGAAKQQVHLAGLKIARTNLRAVVIARQTYRDFLKLCLSASGAAKQQVHLAGLKIARKNLRAVVIARRSYRNFVKLCGQALKAAQQGVLILWKRSIYKSLRAVVKVRRSYRNLAHQYRIAIKSWKLTLSKQVQKVPAALEEIDQSVKKTEEQDQRAYAQFKSRMSSSIDKAVDLCSRRFEKWIVRRKAPAGASVMYQHRHVEKDMSEEMGFSGRKKSFFSKFTERLPTRGRFKNLRVYSLKQWVSFLLIGFVSIYFLVITYLIANRYKDFDFPNIALGESTPRTAKGKRVNSPPLALIAYSVDEKKNRKAAASKNPSGYSFWPKRVTLRHVEGWGEGVSFGTDYSTLAMLFAPDYRVGKIMPMLDLRGHRFDNNTYAANIGIGGRYIPDGSRFCQILGLNAFYDWREGKLGDFQQIGVGLEILGKRWDLRANGYAPISVKQRKIKCVFNNYVGDYYAIHRRCEFTSYGYNAEVGYYAIRGKNFFLYAAGGPYYLVRKCHDRTRGFEFRIRPQYKDYLALDFSVSHDNVFDTVYQAQVILYLPLYQLSKRINKRPCGLYDQQIYQPIERFEIMPLGRRSCWQSNF